MNAFIARTAMIPSSVAEPYRGAHADGYDYADYQADQLAWAKMVYDVAGTPLEGYLFIAAARDYADHAAYCIDHDEKPLPRGKWCEVHVAGQIDRALEIADGI